MAKLADTNEAKKTEKWKMTETLTHEYQHDRVMMIFKSLCVIA